MDACCGWVRRCGLSLVAASSMTAGLALLVLLLRPEVGPHLGTLAVLAVLGLIVMPVLMLGMVAADRQARRARVEEGEVERRLDSAGREVPSRGRRRVMGDGTAEAPTDARALREGV